MFYSYEQPNEEEGFFRVYLLRCPMQPTRLQMAHTMYEKENVLSACAADTPLNCCQLAIILIVKKEKENKQKTNSTIHKDTTDVRKKREMMRRQQERDKKRSRRLGACVSLTTRAAAAVHAWGGQGLSLCSR